MIGVKVINAFLLILFVLEFTHISFDCNSFIKLLHNKHETNIN